MLTLICYNIIYIVYAWRPWRNDPAQSSLLLMKLSVPARCSVTQSFCLFYLNPIVVSWPSSLFHKGYNHHLTLFLCKVRQSSPTASTGRSSLSEKNLSDSLPQSEIGYSWKIFPGLLAFGLFWTVSFLRRKRLRDDGYVDVKKSSDDQNNKLKKTRESGMPI